MVHREAGARSPHPTPRHRPPKKHRCRCRHPHPGPHGPHHRGHCAHRHHWHDDGRSHYLRECNPTSVDSASGLQTLRDETLTDRRHCPFPQCRCTPENSKHGGQLRYPGMHFPKPPCTYQPGVKGRRCLISVLTAFPSDHRLRVREPRLGQRTRKRPPISVPRACRRSPGSRIVQPTHDDLRPSPSSDRVCPVL